MVVGSFIQTTALATIIDDHLLDFTVLYDFTLKLAYLVAIKGPECVNKYT